MVHLLHVIKTYHFHMRYQKYSQIHRIQDHAIKSISTLKLIFQSPKGTYTLFELKIIKDILPYNVCNSLHRYN